MAVAENMNMKIFSGSSNPVLAGKIAKYLGMDLGAVDIQRFPDGETFVKIRDNIRGGDMYVVQSTCRQPNEMLMELLIMIDAMRRASAARITAVLPYFGYARQDRKDQPRVPITAKLIANLLTTAGADRVLTISHFSRETISEHYRISSDKISVAPLCADPLYFRAGETGRRPAALLPEGKYLFYPANRWQHKNHEGLLRALRILVVEKGLDLRLVLTGHDVDGGYPVMQKAAEYGVADRVFPAGYVTPEELAWLYHHAEMMVFPSLFEGFGLPLVEAMAAGCPVAASRAGSMPEVGGDAVENFDPHSAPEMAAVIERVCGSPALRAALSERGRARAAEFSPARLALAHLQAFREARAAYNPLRYAWNLLFERHYDAWTMARKYPACAAAARAKK